MTTSRESWLELARVGSGGKVEKRSMVNGTAIRSVTMVTIVAAGTSERTRLRLLATVPSVSRSALLPYRNAAVHARELGTRGESSHLLPGSESSLQESCGFPGAASVWQQLVTWDLANGLQMSRRTRVR